MTESEAYYCSQSASLYSIEKHEPSDFQLVQHSLCRMLLGITPPPQTFPAMRVSAYGFDKFSCKYPCLMFTALFNTKHQYLLSLEESTSRYYCRHEV